MPVIIVSSHTDVASAVEAMKIGAFDFFENPYDAQSLLDSVHSAVALSHANLEHLTQVECLLDRRASLTTRESQVMACLVRGLRNPEIADQLGVTKRTVELHRQHMMEKMQVDSIAELVSLVHTLATK
jgi:FixJ family two-component response regulator